MQKIDFCFSHEKKVFNALAKWKVLDIQSLKVNSNYAKGYGGFCHLIRKYENEKILESFSHPWTRKKYVYISDKGRSQMKDETYIDGKIPYVKDEILQHDVQVSLVVNELFKERYIHYFQMEHEYKDEFRSSDICPDAILYANIENKNGYVALEVERTKKSKVRIVNKFKEYVGNSSYGNVLYIFGDKYLCEKYVNILKEHVGTMKDRKTKRAYEKILFACDSMLEQGHSNILNSTFYSYDNYKSFKGLFSKMEVEQ